MRFRNIDIQSETNSEWTETIRKESAHIIDMYFRLIKFYENDHCKKLNIYCNDIITDPSIKSSRNGYICLQMPFCPHSLSSLSEKDKSSLYLNLIHHSIKYIGCKWGWNLQYFDFIRHCIISSNFKNQWMHGKPSPCAGNDKSAYLRVIQTIREANIILMITENKTVTGKIPIATTDPAFWDYRQYLGKIRWTDSHHIEIIGKEEQIIFQTSDV